MEASAWFWKNLKTLSVAMDGRMRKTVNDMTSNRRSSTVINNVNNIFYAHRYFFMFVISVHIYIWPTSLTVINKPQRNKWLTSRHFYWTLNNCIQVIFVEPDRLIQNNMLGK